VPYGIGPWRGEPEIPSPESLPPGWLPPAEYGLGQYAGEPQWTAPMDPQSQENWRFVTREGDRAMMQGMYPAMVGNLIGSMGGAGARGLGPKPVKRTEALRPWMGQRSKAYHERRLYGPTRWTDREPEHEAGPYERQGEHEPYPAEVDLINRYHEWILARQGVKNSAWGITTETELADWLRPAFDETSLESKASQARPHEIIKAARDVYEKRMETIQRARNRGVGAGG